MKFIQIANSHLFTHPLSKNLLTYFIEMTSYFPQEDRNQSIVRDLDVYLAKGNLQTGNTTSEGNLKRLLFTSGGQV